MCFSTQWPLWACWVAQSVGGRIWGLCSAQPANEPSHQPLVQPAPEVLLRAGIYPENKLLRNISLLALEATKQAVRTKSLCVGHMQSWNILSTLAAHFQVSIGFLFVCFYWVVQIPWSKDKVFITFTVWLPNWLLLKHGYYSNVWEIISQFSILTVDKVWKVELQCMYWMAH